MVEDASMSIYVEEDGHFCLTMDTGNPEPKDCFGYYVGSVSKEGEKCMDELGRWIVEEAPYSEFPDSLTREEVAIVKEKSRVWCNWGPEDG